MKPDLEVGFFVGGDWGVGSVGAWWTETISAMVGELGSWTRICRRAGGRGGSMLVLVRWEPEALDVWGFLVV